MEVMGTGHVDESDWCVGRTEMDACGCDFPLYGNKVDRQRTGGGVRLTLVSGRDTLSQVGNLNQCEVVGSREDHWQAGLGGCRARCPLMFH